MFFFILFDFSIVIFLSMDIEYFVTFAICVTRVRGQSVFFEINLWDSDFFVSLQRILIKNRKYNFVF